MAMFNYGAIAIKNGELISTGVFTPMKETCGFSDKRNTLGGVDFPFDGNCFVVIGDKQFLVGFYKESVFWWFDHGNSWDEDRYESGEELLGWCDYHGWTSWNKSFSTFKKTREITVKPRNGYYVAKILIGTDTYKVYFGYGVNLRFYKKTGRINYSRSPEYFMKKLQFKLSLLFQKDRFRMKENREVTK